MAVVGSNKRQVWLPTDHAYPIKDKLRDCGMTKSCMTSRSLS
jgi:hypothetical protein